jgi:hypothetical protein
MLNPPGDGVNESSEDWYVCEECGAAYNIKDAYTLPIPGLRTTLAPATMRAAARRIA